MKKLQGVVDLPLHTGKCPSWLFPLMRELSGKISEVIVEEYSTDELLKRFSNPYWFQAFGCALGFDWHSSGLTTTTCGALKESLSKLNLGVQVAGGKGKISKNTPSEITELGDKINLSEKKINQLIRNSKISAKVDNSLLQDNFNLYHHNFIFTKNKWAIIQQGMNENYARRYHWIAPKNLINEPHKGIISDTLTKPLNLTHKKTIETRNCSLDLIKENPIHLKKHLSNKNPSQTTLSNFQYYKLPKKHFPKITADMKTLMKAYESQPTSYEDLISIKGMGKKNIRALALISNLIHGTELSWTDPCKYSFAHGGKDGWPEPVNKQRFNHSINFLKTAIKDSKIKNRNKYKALRRLNKYTKSI